MPGALLAQRVCRPPAYEPPVPRLLSAARLTDFNRGVGLTNTRSRLQHLYGGDHRFEFRQRPGGGLQVLIAIPLMEAQDDDTVPRFDRSRVSRAEGVA